MRLALLLLLPSLVFADQWEVAIEKAAAEEWVRELYLSRAVERYCKANPEGVYEATYKGRPIMVNCEVRNKWVDLYRRGEVPRN